MCSTVNFSNPVLMGRVIHYTKAPFRLLARNITTLPTLSIFGIKGKIETS